MRASEEVHGTVFEKLTVCQQVKKHSACCGTRSWAGDNSVGIATTDWTVRGSKPVCSRYISVGIATTDWTVRGSKPVCSRYISVGIATTDWTVRGSKPVGGEFSTPFQPGPRARTFSSSTGTGSYPGVKQSGRGFKH
jgi:hypothetical protein